MRRIRTAPAVIRQRSNQKKIARKIVNDIYSDVKNQRGHNALTQGENTPVYKPGRYKLLSAIPPPK